MSERLRTQPFEINGAKLVLIMEVSKHNKHCFFFGCIHLLQVANFYLSYPFQSLVVKKWRHPQLYLEKNQNFYVNPLINKCPGFPGNSWQKELAKKKQGSDPKNTNLQFTPPIATNMEVNLRIVTLVNAEEKNMIFLHIIFVFFASIFSPLSCPSD